MPFTPFPDLNAVLSELVAGAQAVLTDSFLGAYLQGSFAVGDFDQHSDVDFIVVIAQEPTGAQVAALQELHARLYHLDSTWAQHLEGSYFPQAPLRQLVPPRRKLWYIDNGQRALERSEHDNTLVVRAVLHEHGVTLAGPPAATFVDPVPVDVLRQEIRHAMTSWWAEIQADPECINNHFYQAYAVLNYCRMLHDLHTGRVGSKRAGAEWAQANLDPNQAGWAWG